MELRITIRQLLKQPGFMAVAVSTLALGIGVNLAVIALANGLFLRPMSGVRPDPGLVTIAKVYRGNPSVHGAMTFPEYRDLRESQASFSEVAAFAPSPFNLAAGDRGERVLGEMVSANYLRTLGVPMLHGRDFRAEEDAAPGAHPVAILSERLWRERWGGDVSVIGSAISINTHSFTVIGVAGGGFRGYQLPTGYDVWIPLAMARTVQAGATDRYEDGKLAWIPRLAARLKPGVSTGTAGAELDVISNRWAAREAAEGQGTRLLAVEYSPFPAVNKRPALLFVGILTGLTGLVLLVVCANVAALFLSRALARQRDAMIRLSLGSSRWRLVRQTLVEGFLASSLGVGAGLLIGIRGATFLVGMIPGDGGEPVVLDAVLDGRVALAAGVLALVCTAGVSLLPALHASRVRVNAGLKSAEGHAMGRRSRARSLLVGLQVAFSVVLLVAAVLLFRSLDTLRRWDPGMRMDGLLVANLDLGLNQYDLGRADRLTEALAERLSALPGVESAALASQSPLEMGASSVRLKGAEGSGEEQVVSFMSAVGPGYFRTTGIPLLRGREFSEQDRRDAPRVVVVNEVMARRLWPDQDALGQWLEVVDRPGERRMVVGVTRAAVLSVSELQDGRREASPYFYIPVAQSESLMRCVHVRTRGDAASMLPPVRRAVAELDANLPLFQAAPLRTLRNAAFWQQRLTGALVLVSGGMAIVLSMIGLYSAIAQEVIRRRREIGVRLAIGAQTRDILRLLIRQGMRLVGGGLGVGVILSLVSTRVLASLLRGVSPTDPLTFGSVAGFLFGMGLLACWLAARRAARVDPVEALRGDGA